MATNHPLFWIFSHYPDCWKLHTSLCIHPLGCIARVEPCKTCTLYMICPWKIMSGLVFAISWNRWSGLVGLAGLLKVNCWRWLLRFTVSVKAWASGSVGRDTCQASASAPGVEWQPTPSQGSSSQFWPCHVGEGGGCHVDRRQDQCDMNSSC